MNRFLLTKVKNPECAGRKEVGYDLNLEGPSPLSPHTNICLVPKLYKIDNLKLIYHYKDVMDKGFINIDSLKKQLVMVEQQMQSKLQNNQNPGKTQTLYMPLPKAIKNEAGESYFSCSICSSLVYSPEVEFLLSALLLCSAHCKISSLKRIQTISSDLYFF